MHSAKTKIYQILSSFNQIKWSIAIKGLITGFVVGLLVVLYRLGIDYGTETALKIFAYFKVHPLWILVWLAAAILVGLLIAYLVKKEPMATGSGIPQVEGVVLYGLKMRSYSILGVRFIAGILGSFFGLSLGREGPSIQIGAAGGDALAKRWSKNPLEEKYLVTGGAAAGLSAAFNAPLSGMVFALEEVHRSFSPIILLSATAASLSADFVSEYFFGLKPVLNFTTIPQLPLKFYLLLLPLGILSGLIGSSMNKTLLGFQSLFRKLPAFCRPVVAILIALPCGIFLPLTLGSGQNLIGFAESVQTGITMLLLLLVVKILFTGTSFGSGIPGGIFMPILAVGTLTGSIFGVAASYLGIPTSYIPDFAICAMAGALAASVKAPVTAILLTAEMSGTLVHMLPVAACAFLALLVSDLLKTDPIYEALLERFVEQNGDTLPKQERGGLVEFPVEIGSAVAGNIISQITWPPNSLVVGIRRGTRETVPKGDTRVMPGDYLVILSSDENEDAIRKQMIDLCHAK